MKIENKLYNPADQSSESLVKNFVVRTNTFEKIFKDIKQGKMKRPEQHYIIQGQRGMGKTTLLLRIKYEIEKTPELNDWLIPVFFSEETYDVTSLSNLWEKLLKYLDELWQTGGEYYNKTEAYLDQPDYEKKCLELLIEILHARKKKLLVLYDNFGELFLDNLSEKETHRFREILMSCADIRIIGTSSVVLEDIHDYSKPFYEFFKIIYLEGLNKEETYQLIANLQENEKPENKIDLEKNKAKIETLAILTGGVIRTAMLIYEAILNDKDGSALKDLGSILDLVTPLYKHKIEVLPVQQRKIVDVIAKKWDAATTKEISESIREDGKLMPSKVISAQLQQLERNNFIEKKEQKNTKNNLYQLRERFFNIWYLMRHGDNNDRCRVIWYTKYLEMFYGGDGLKSFVSEHIQKLQSGIYNPESALFVANAVANSDTIDIATQDLLIKETTKILNDNQKSLIPKSDSQIFNEILDLIKRGDKIKALQLFNKVTRKNKQIDTLKAIVLFLFQKWEDSIKLISPSCNPNIASDNNYILGSSLYQLKRYSEAIKYLQASLTDISKKDAYEKLGKIFELQNNIQKAEYFYLQAISVGNSNAIEGLAGFYSNIGNTDKAIEYFLKAYQNGNVNVLPRLGFIYLAKMDFINARKYFEIGVDSKVALNYIAYLGLTLVNFVKKQYVEAEENLIKYYNEYDIVGNMIEDKGTKNIADVIQSAIFFYRKVNREAAYNLVKEVKFKNELNYLFLLISLVLLWNNKFEESFNSILNFFNKNENEVEEDEIEIVNTLFELFIAKKQYHSALKLFEMEKLQLKDKLKPTYYALMHYLKDEYPNEILRMGEELKEPVNDVIKQIEQMAIDYA